MKNLFETVATPMINGMFVVRITEHITMVLPPRSIVDFNHNGFDCDIGSVVAVIKAGRIEAISKISQMGQQTNRPVRSVPDVCFNKISNSGIHGRERIAEMIFPAKIRNIESLVGPQRVDIEKRGQLLKIEVHKKQPILKHVRPGPKAPMPYSAFIYGTLYHDNVFPKCLQTDRALFTPSS
jgi:hypothetical protein